MAVEMMRETSLDGRFHVLSLDGGGAKGVYTLGVLKEVEAWTGRPLYQVFELIYGTSTGAIIAALLAAGRPVSEVLDLYLKQVPRVMKRWTARGRSRALTTLADQAFGGMKFDALKTGVGLVCTNWASDKPMIFKTDIRLAHGMKSSFVPGFGCTVSAAVQASCSAYPFFRRVRLSTINQGTVELADGGFCANNPTLYALADATRALDLPETNLAILSVGVGNYPQRRPRFFTRVARYLPTYSLLQKVLAVNVASIEQLQGMLFAGLHIVRVNETFQRPELATDFLESDTERLNLLYQEGRQSFGRHEQAIHRLLEGS